MADIFPGTAAQLEEWKADPEVLGVVLVGSKSREYADALSDDDLEVLFTDEAHARLTPAQCHSLYIEGEGANRRIIYDAQLTSLSDLQRKAASPLDLDHWPYEKARVLFDRDGRTAEAVKAAGRMDPDFRRKRLLHGTIDTWTAPRRAAKTYKRGAEAGGRLLIARGAKALARVLFALEWRWLPMDHWLEAELKTLQDPTGAGKDLVEALVTASPEPLERALNGLEELLFAEGVPRSPDRIKLFLELVHPSRAAEREIHGLY